MIALPVSVFALKFAVSATLMTVLLVWVIESTTVTNRSPSFPVTPDSARASDAVSEPAVAVTFPSSIEFASNRTMSCPDAATDPTKSCVASSKMMSFVAESEVAPFTLMSPVPASDRPPELAVRVIPPDALTSPTSSASASVTVMSNPSALTAPAKRFAWFTVITFPLDVFALKFAASGTLITVLLVCVIESTAVTNRSPSFPATPVNASASEVVSAPAVTVMFPSSIEFASNRTMSCPDAATDPTKSCVVSSRTMSSVAERDVAPFTLMSPVPASESPPELAVKVIAPKALTSPTSSASASVTVTSKPNAFTVPANRFA